MDLSIIMSITREDIIRLVDSPEFSAEVIHVLRRNGEAITENSNGYFFEFAKVKDSTIQELTTLIDKYGAISDVKEEPMCETDVPYSRTVYPPTVLNDNKNDYTTSSSIKISQKFINEYSLDLEKTAGKPLSILKFINSKKKYMRSAETLLSKNEPALKKEPYIIN